MKQIDLETHSSKLSVCLPDILSGQVFHRCRWLSSKTNIVKDFSLKRSGAWPLLTDMSEGRAMMETSTWQLLHGDRSSTFCVLAQSPPSAWEPLSSSWRTPASRTQQLQLNATPCLKKRTRLTRQRSNTCFDARVSTLLWWSQQHRLPGLKAYPTERGWSAVFCPSDASQVHIIMKQYCTYQHRLGSIPQTSQHGLDVLMFDGVAESRMLEALKKTWSQTRVHIDLPEQIAWVDSRR